MEISRAMERAMKEGYEFEVNKRCVIGCRKYNFYTDCEFYVRVIIDSRTLVISLNGCYGDIADNIKAICENYDF